VKGLYSRDMDIGKSQYSLGTILKISGLEST
jgi:hypothetical protein